MLIVALALLPTMGLLLIGMDLIEDRMSGDRRRTAAGRRPRTAAPPATGARPADAVSRPVRP